MDAERVRELHRVGPADLDIVVPVMLADVVAGTDRCHGEAGREIGLAARLERHHLQALDVHGVAFGAAADPRCCTLRSLRQQIARTLPQCDALDHRLGRVDIAEAEVEAVEIAGGEDAAFHQFHREREREAERDRVHAKLVEPRVVGDQRGDIGRADVGAHGTGHLLVHGARADVAPAFDVIDLHAVVGAARAGRDATVMGRPVGLGVVVDPLERRRAKVVHVQRRVDPVIVNPDGETRLLLLPACQDVVGNGGRKLGADALAGRLVRQRRRRAALEHDRLQLLGAHHRAHPHALSLVGAAADDAGEAHHVLAGRPDYGDLSLAAEPALQRVRRLVRREPPLWRGVEERHRAVFDQEAQGTVRRTVEDEGVVA